MKRLIYTLVISLCCTFSYAQTTILKGKVMDASDNFSLPGATLRLEEGNRYTISDPSGSFEFLNIPSCTYTLTVSYMGYQPYQQTISVNGKEEQIQILLQPAHQSLGEVQIIGDIARGQAKALNQQKNNSNITNIISSDQVGRFPDQNIGDALKRVPGITMQNDQGEARNIIVRGLAPELNSVTLNGDRIPSAEGDNRNVQMDLIPSDMIATIEVNKTLTPDMDADAIGGSVNLITRAVPNRRRISATLSGGYAPIREKGLYNGAFVYGDRYANNKVGLVLSATMQTQNFGSDNIEAVWEQEGSRTFLDQMDVRKYDVQRIRRSFSLASDYEINSRNRLELNAIYNWRDDRENRYRTRYRSMEWDEDQQTYIGDIRRETKGGIDKRNNNTRLEDQRVMNFSLKGEHLLTSKLDFDWAASYSKASEDRPHERYIDFDLGEVALGQDLSDPYHPLVVDNHTDYSQFALRKLTENHDYTSEDEFGAKFNFRLPMSVIQEQKGRLRFGGRLRLKNKKRDNIFYEYTPEGAVFGAMNTLPMEHWSGNGYQPGEQYVPGGYIDKRFLGVWDLQNAFLFEESADPSEYLAVNYKAKERIVAGYVRWDQNFTERTSMIVGARVEHTNIDYTGNFVEDEETLAGSVNNKNSYVNFLPSLTLRHDVSRDFILRAAVTTGLARPNYYALAPYINSLPGDTEIDAGNPQLKATYATNFDFMAENYFQNVGIVSAGAFYKRLNDFIYRYTDRSYTSEKFAADFPDVANPIPAGEEWRFRQHRNGDNVDVYGFEVAFQRQLDFLPGRFFKGLGIYANYTFTHSKAKGVQSSEDGDARTGLGLPKTAPHMLNGSLSWENSKFSARVSANYAAAYLDGIGESEFYDEYYDKQFFLDANASYKVTPQLRIFGEANNLTNQPLRYYQGSKERMMQLEYYKPRFTLGVKFDM